jgi:hypothetical protein
MSEAHDVFLSDIYEQYCNTKIFFCPLDSSFGEAVILFLEVE